MSLAVNFGSYTVGTKFSVGDKMWCISAVGTKKSSKGRNVRVFTVVDNDGREQQKTSRGLTLWINGSGGVAEAATADVPVPAEVESVSVDSKSGVFVPPLNSSYYITPDVESLFGRVAKLSATKTQKIMLLGPHGAGKTEMAMHFAARLKRPMLIMDCANLKEPRDWFGYKTIENGEVVWHESQFDRAVTEGKHVILFDEINRVHPMILNTLLPLLDGRGFTYLEEKGECIRVGEGTIFFATMNEGSNYTGTTSTDSALRDRFNRHVEVTYLPKDKEIELLVTRTGIDREDAKKLVEIVGQIRKKSTGLGSQFSTGFSTRQLIAVAEDFVIDGVDSLTFTMTNLFSAEGGTNSERASVLQLIQGKFGTDPSSKKPS